MASVAPPRKILQAILSGEYTPLDLREFVQFCYSLALPFVRRKVAHGKLRLDTLGLKELDVVYDCLADLFQRDEQGRFVQISTYFEAQKDGLQELSNEVLLIELRRLVFGKIHNNIIRLYGEADPILAKILRNMKLSLEKTELFETVTRFGELYLVPRDIDLLPQLPVIPVDFLRDQFARTAHVHDNVPSMLKSLREVVSHQNQFRRAVPLVLAALLFKEVYSLAWDTEEAESGVVDRRMEREDLERLADRVCAELRREMYETYVGKGKRNEHVFDRYIGAVREMLVGAVGNGPTSAGSYYSYLRLQMPRLTRKEYMEKHRTVLEYLAKKAKERMREELKRL